MKSKHAEAIHHIPGNYHVENNVHSEHDADMAEMEVFGGRGRGADGVPLHPWPRQLCSEHELQSQAHRRV